MFSLGLVKALEYAIEALESDRPNSYKARAAVKRLTDELGTRRFANSNWGKKYRAQKSGAASPPVAGTPTGEVDENA